MENNKQIVKHTEKKNIEDLKKLVEKEIGFKVKYAKNCDILSELIFERAGKKLSSSTLKRFWGIIKRKFNPSQYTLDTLSKLVGFSDWNNFIENKNKRNAFEIIKKTKQKFRNISKANINFLRTQSPRFFYEIAKRQFASQKLEKFLTSDKKAIPFLAYDGFGKTEILIKLAEEYFLKPEAKYKDDLCLFITFSTVNITEKQNFDISYLLKKVFKLNDNEELDNYIKKILSKKRLVIFLDKICKIYKNDKVFPRIITEFYNIFIGKYAKYNIKLILSCKVDQWYILQREFEQSTKIKALWFDNKFNEKTKPNIPPLSRIEVIRILKSEIPEFNLSHISANNKLLEILAVPYFTKIYIYACKQSNSIMDEIDLLNFYIKKEVLIGLYTQERLEITDKIIEKTNFGLTKARIGEDEIKLNTRQQAALKQLVKINFISESIQVTDYFKVIKELSFSNLFIFKYLIINSWLRKYDLTPETIEKILKFYGNNNKIKISLLIWLIKIAAKKENLEVFKNIYETINKHFIKGDPRKAESRKVKKLIDTVGVELRKSKALRDQLLPVFVKEIISRDFYFRTFIDVDYLNKYYYNCLEYFITSNISKNDLFYTNILLFLKEFLNLSLNESCKPLSVLNKIQKESNDKIYTINYQSCKHIYSNYTNNKLPIESLMRNMVAFNKTEKFDNKTVQNISFFLLFEALEVTENYELILESLNENTLLNCSSFREKNNYLINFLNIYKAKALLKLKDFDNASQILKTIDAGRFPEGQKLFWNIKFNLVSAEYFLNNLKLKPAKELLNEAFIISETLNYKLFISKINSLIDNNTKIPVSSAS